MIAAGLVDELHVLVAPALDGDDGRQGIVIVPDGGLKARTQLSLIDCEQREQGTVLLRYRVRTPAVVQPQPCSAPTRLLVQAPQKR